MTDSHLCKLRGDALALLKDDRRPLVITGASGWFGRCLLEALHSAMPRATFDERVLPFSSRGAEVRLRGGQSIQTRHFSELRQQCPEQSVLLHFAYLTKEQAVGRPLVDYIQANRDITNAAIETLSAQRISAFFMPSSGAVYRPAADEPQYTEANAYAKLKREDEKRAFEWCQEASDRRAVICRVFNVSGPYINKYSDYALASAIDCALRGVPITIRTPRRTLRSFTAVDDLLSIVLAQLLDPHGPHTPLFDSAGAQVVEIDELVAQVQATLGTTVTLQRPPRVDEEDRYLGEPHPYLDLLARYHVASATLDEQILQTAAYIRQFPGA
jgi:UDP-glucuronate decarboxylase